MYVSLVIVVDVAITAELVRKAAYLRSIRSMYISHMHIHCTWHMMMTLATTSRTYTYIYIYIYSTSLKSTHLHVALLLHTIYVSYVRVCTLVLMRISYIMYTYYIYCGYMMMWCIVWYFNFVLICTLYFIYATITWYDDTIDAIARDDGAAVLFLTCSKCPLAIKKKSLLLLLRK